jgi:RiboL-PSP-HEPN
MSPEIVRIAETYKIGLSELDLIVRATECEVIDGSGNSLLITGNVNFFTKSFLISTCAHLEMCIKEVVFAAALELDGRLLAASIPMSIFEWRFNSKKKGDPSGLQNQRVSIGMTKKEVDDLVSGNVFKTKDALALVGIDLSTDKASWETWKELIQAMVTRRNNIVHHNDDASDLSLGDIRGYIKSTISYIDFIVFSCNSACNIQHNYPVAT